MQKDRTLPQRGPSSKSSPLNFATGNKIHLFCSRQPAVPAPMTGFLRHSTPLPLSFSHTTHAQTLELEEIQILNLVLAVYWHGRCKSFGTALWNGLEAKEID